MNATTTNNQIRKGLSYMRLTVHLHGPSVQYEDPKKEHKEVEGRKIKNKKRIMNTLTFKHVRSLDVTQIINELKGKYPHLYSSTNMPDGIKWYLSRMK
mgnify:CR=1 FL=1